MKNINTKLFDFIKESPTQFHAVESIETILKKNDYKELKETKAWKLNAGSYYVKRNNSSIIAFNIPKTIKDYHFQICSSHTDSPTFKVKCEGELKGPAEYLRLNVEKYGGAIFYTWLDRPLTLAGRVYVKKDNKVVSKNLYIDEDLLIIPSLPIHFNRSVNDGVKFNAQIDLCPLFSSGELHKGDFVKMLAKHLNVKPKDIVSYDLYLVNRQCGKEVGYHKEFIASAKLDDLQAAYTSLCGFIDAKTNGCINVYCSFDNEEVGSLTMQGAMSTFLSDVLNRINNGLNKTIDDYYQAVAKSFMISFDNAHALHPNHPEKYDEDNRCYMNKGIVIKENASQSYTTDSFSRSIFKEICAKAKTPVQCFANRSDEKGGSTLGNLSNSQVSLHTVDIGLAQLAMHSSFETAGSKDSEYAYNAIKEYYSRLILIEDTNSFIVK